MTTRWTAWLCAPLCLCLSGLGLAGVAQADDNPLAPPPAEPGAPAAPEPSTRATGPVVPTSAERTRPTPAAKSGTGWGAPSTSPTSGPSADLLPAPVVRNPRTGKATGGLPPSTGPSAPTPGTAPGTTAAAPGSPRPVGAQILSVTKVHNVPLPNGQLALRMDIAFTAIGQQGRNLHLAAAYARTGTGVSIQSMLPEYAGESGAIVSKTAPVRVQADGQYRASLWVPYGAFPAAAAGSSYSVSVLVQVQRGEARGRTSVMSHQRTAFTVHGPALTK